MSLSQVIDFSEEVNSTSNLKLGGKKNIEVSESSDKKVNSPLLPLPDVYKKKPLNNGKIINPQDLSSHGNLNHFQNYGDEKWLLNQAYSSTPVLLPLNSLNPHPYRLQTFIQNSFLPDIPPGYSLTTISYLTPTPAASAVVEQTASCNLPVINYSEVVQNPFLSKCSDTSLYQSSKMKSQTVLPLPYFIPGNTPVPNQSPIPNSPSFWDSPPYPLTTSSVNSIFSSIPNSKSQDLLSPPIGFSRNSDEGIFHTEQSLSISTPELSNNKKIENFRSVPQKLQVVSPTFKKYVPSQNRKAELVKKVDLESVKENKVKNNSSTQPPDLKLGSFKVYIPKKCPAYLPQTLSGLSLFFFFIVQ
jgi:hypothetical protein